MVDWQFSLLRYQAHHSLDEPLAFDSMVASERNAGASLEDLCAVVWEGTELGFLIQWGRELVLTMITRVDIAVDYVLQVSPQDQGPVPVVALQLQRAKVLHVLGLGARDGPPWTFDRPHPEIVEAVLRGPLKVTQDRITMWVEFETGADEGPPQIICALRS